MQTFHMRNIKAFPVTNVLPAALQICLRASRGVRACQAGSWGCTGSSPLPGGLQRAAGITLLSRVLPGSLQGAAERYPPAFGKRCLHLPERMFTYWS